MITLYRFPYSCYALKVQYLLSYLGLPHQVKDVPFCDRSELVALTGKVMVPAIDHDGKVLTESRDICAYLVGLIGNNLIPSGMEAAVWAYVDWSDEILEDVLFRIASVNIAKMFSSPQERALFTFIKERKFGSGCIGEWARQQAGLIEKARRLLHPTFSSLSHHRFLLGSTISLADFSLAGHLAMVEYASPELLDSIDERLIPYLNTVREARNG